MVDLAIIADDLTGALDSAAPFAMRGLGTSVALGVGALTKALSSGARIVSISTDSRDMAPDAATASVRAALSCLPPGTPVLKKVDSRLKGNVAAELDSIPHQRSLVVPAIPEFGRLTRNGRIRGFGITEPIDIAARLGQHAGTAIIPDIESVHDIHAALMLHHDLAVGARSLADAMARKMAPDMSVPELALPKSAAYCVIGSTDPITLAQLSHLRGTFPGMTDIRAPNGKSGAQNRTLSRLTLLQATPGPRPAAGEAVAMALGASMQRLAPPPDTLLVLSGGATAQVILGVLGVEVLELMGEVLPGLPMARAGRLTVVTKSGGFGDPDTLSRLLRPYFSVGSPDQSHAG